MINYLEIIFIIILFFILNFFLNRVSIYTNIVDQNINGIKIPLSGGILIYLCYLLSFSFSLPPFEITKVSIYLSIIILLGILDDYLKLDVLPRLSLHLLLSFFLVFEDFIIFDLGTYPFFGTINLYYLKYIFTLLFIVAFANSFNFIDGKDGQLGSLSFFSLLMFYLFLFFNGFEIQDINYLLIIIILIFFFLILNLNIFKYFRQIYLGNSGSIFLGFLAAVLIIYYQRYEKIDFLVLLWFFTIPIFDFVHIVFKRIFEKKNPVKKSFDHIHDLFEKNSINSFKSLLILNLLNIFFTVTGISIFYYFNALASVLYYLSAFSIYCLSKNRLY